eukprot:m.361591 g.361591  ORF g.361591 m.361591 type:complete len:1396 (-) comp19959_c0_seq1:20-4207(-)
MAAAKASGQDVASASHARITSPSKAATVATTAPATPASASPYSRRIGAPSSPAQPPQPLLLSALVTRGLLEAEPDTSVLDAFPQQVQRSIILPVVEFVKLPGPSTLTSEAHVKWVMQCVGKGLGLPITEEKTIRSCIHIYSDWFQLKSWIPQPVKEEPSVFFGEMIKHLSQPFRVATKPQTADPTLGTTVQVDACKRVLSIFNNVLRWHPLLSDQASIVDTLLRVILGVVDELLSEPEGDVPLADELCDDLLGVMFNMWLTVCCQAFPSDCLWDVLRDHSRNWRHRRKFYLWWRFVCQSLARRLVRITTNTDDAAGTKPTRLRADDGLAATVSAMPPEVLVHTWHRLTFLIEDPNFAAPGPPRQEALSAVNEFVDILFGTEDTLKPMADCGTILRLFGTWLFTACDLALEGHDRAKAQALPALCHVFCSPNAATEIDRKYFPAFYSVVAHGLAHVRLAPTILVGCQNLFSRNLPGCFTLVLPVVAALRRLFSVANQRKRDTREYVTVSRAAAQILASLASFPNHFGTAPLPFSPLSSTKVDMPTFASMKFRFADICLDGIRTEKDPKTLNMLMCTLQLLVLDEESRRVAHRKTDAGSSAPSSSRDAAASRSFESRRTTMGAMARRELITAAEKAATAKVTAETPPSVTRNTRTNPQRAKPPPLVVTKAVLLLLERLQSLMWPMEVSLSAIEALNGFVPLFPVIHRSDPSLPDKLILSLCSYISKQISQPKQRHTKTLHTMIVAGYQCLGHWIRSYPQLACSDASLKALLRVVLLGVVGTSSGGDSAEDSLCASEAPWSIRKSGPKLLPHYGGRAEATQSPSYRVQEAASHLLRRLYSLGSPMQTSTQNSDEEIEAVLRVMQVQREKNRAEEQAASSALPLDHDVLGTVRYFVVDEHTVVAVCSNTSTEAVQLIVRDDAGRTMWSLAPKSSSSSQFERQASSVMSVHTPHPSGLNTAARRAAPTETHPGWSAFVAEAERTFAAFSTPTAPLEDTLMGRVVEAQAVGERVVATKTLVSAAQPVVGMESADVAQNIVTTFFNHLCMWPRSTPCESSRLREIVPDADGQFLDTLTRLDAIPDRDRCHTVVACVGTGGTLYTPPQNSGTEHHELFWNLFQRLGCKDQDRLDAQGQSSESCDLLFQQHPGTQPARAAILIVESPQRCAPSETCQQVCPGVIVFVAPIRPGMFYTKTHVPPGAHHLSAGPLCDWQIVNARILVHTLCSTLSNSVLRAQCRQDGYVLPHVARKRLIEKLLKDAEDDFCLVDRPSHSTDSPASSAASAPGDRGGAAEAPLKVLSCWFKKRSEKIGRDHSRFFVLSDTTIEYYGDVRNGTPVGHRGTIRLVPSDTEIACDGAVLTIKTRERDWVLVADNVEDARTWARRLRSIVGASSTTSSSTA